MFLINISAPRSFRIRYNNFAKHFGNIEHGLNVMRVEIRHIMDAHFCESVGFDYSNSRTVSGCCNYDTGMIYISRHFVKVVDSHRLFLSVIHELAHMLTPRHGHDDIWRRVNMGMGGDGVVHCPHFSEPRWWLNCSRYPKCPYNKHKLRRYRKDKRIDGFYCDCGGHLRYTRNLAGNDSCQPRITDILHSGSMKSVRFGCE